MKSELIELGRVELPEFSGVRCQMMPFRVDDPSGTVPFEQWRPLVSFVCSIAKEHGVGFVTIDEAIVQPGQHHRRPGLHVDCGGSATDHGGAPPPAPKHGGSPPAPGPAHGASGGHGGMFTVASHRGCRGYVGIVAGDQGADGDCSHLLDRIAGLRRVDMLPDVLYWANHTFIHETLPAAEVQARQFVRVSMPSAAPWHSDYTPSPIGIRPAGPIVGPRQAQMAPIQLRAAFDAGLEQRAADYREALRERDEARRQLAALNEELEEWKTITCAPNIERALVILSDMFNSEQTQRRRAENADVLLEQLHAALDFYARTYHMRIEHDHTGSGVADALVKFHHDELALAAKVTP